MKPKSDIKAEKQDPTISLCMIVKDEEKFLPACLESVKGHVDEIIVVDTGSSDRTVEIAKGHNAKIYHHAWENSFSKARNQSLEYATCDWVLILDADEEVDKGDAHKLREAIKGNNVNVIYLPVYSKFDEGKNIAIANSERLIRNHLGFHYEGIVHNRLKFKGAGKNVNIKVYHHGYNQSSEEMEKKFIRTSTLLKERIKENPEDPVPHHYLATSYLERRKNDECIQAGLEAAGLYELHNSKEQTRLLNYFTVSVAFLRKNDLDNAELYCRKALDLLPDYIDAYSLLSSIYYLRKEYDKCLEFTSKYLQLLKSIESDPSRAMLIPYNTLSHGWMAHSRLAIIYYERANENEGSKALKDALDSTDRKWAVYFTVGKHFFGRKDFKMAERFFKDGLKTDPHNKALLFNTAETCKKLGSLEEAVACLGKIIEIYPDQTSAHYAQGLVLFEDNRFEESIKAFNLVINNDPKHVDAFFNMGNAYERLGSFNSDESSYLRAEECLLNALNLDKASIKALISLSKIYIYLNDPDKCVVCCDELLKILDLPRDITIENLAQLSFLYTNIGSALQGRKKELLAKAAFEIAGLLNPEKKKTTQID